MHDNSHATLADVVDTYSRFILPLVPALDMPRVSPPEFPGLPAEALTPQDKADLLAFLARRALITAREPQPATSRAMAGSSGPRRLPHPHLRPPHPA
jgi:hypothetical protein